MIEYYTKEMAQEFASRWLPAWSGNHPELLTSFYAEDAFYLDPAIPQGIRGKAALLTYFTKLLARFPDWKWTQRDAIPMEGGFLNKWNAVIPLKNTKLEIDGVCSVQMRDGLIKRNEVYFDRTELLKLI